MVLRNQCKINTEFNNLPYISERNAITLEGLVSTVQNIQTSMMKMMRVVDDLDEKVQSSLSRHQSTDASSPSQQCQCNVTSLANDVKAISDWKDDITPVITEILNKSKMSVFSQTKICETLDIQKKKGKSRLVI